MKKYFINGALALIVGFTYTSCKNNDVDYVPIAQQKTQAYAEAFKEMIGGEVDPNQNWGFETITISEEELAAARAAVRAGTRTTIKEKHDWESRGITKPTPLTETERQDVRHYFNTHKFSDNGTDPKLSEYWVEFVSREDTSTVMYHKNGTVTSWGVRNFTYDQFSVESKNNPSGYEQVNDWNGDSHPTYFLEDVGTSKFRIWLSYTSEWNYNYTIQSYKGNLYVAFDLYGSKWNDNGEEHMGETSLGYYNDYIVRLIPKDSEPQQEEITNQGGGVSTSSTTVQKIYRKTLMLQGRVFCEDLANAKRADIDFNDIVFDARIWKITKFTRTTKDGISNDSPDDFVKYEGEVCLLAAGGTIPAKVAYKDVHELFGVGLTTMVNTVDGNSNVKITWANSEAEKKPVTFTFDMTSLITQNGDKASLDLIPIEVLWTSNDPNDASIVGTMQTVGNLDANVGNVPYKFCVPIGTPWASERNPITSVYSGFADWAKKAGNEPSWTNGVNCYQNKAGLPTDSKYQKGYWEVYKSEEKPETTTTSEIIFWKGSSPIVFADNDNGSNKTIEMIDTYNFQVGDKIRVYTTGIKNNAWISVHGLFNNDSQWRKYLDFAPSGEYNEFTVDQSMLNNITKKIAIWGRGCSITQISRWRKTVTTN